MTQKHEFASPGWFKFLHETMERLVRDAPDDLRWSVCEVFTDVPEHLSQTPDRTASWHCASVREPDRVVCNRPLGFLIYGRGPITWPESARTISPPTTGSAGFASFGT